jgi:hypothetical protein
MKNFLFLLLLPLFSLPAFSSSLDGKWVERADTGILYLSYSRYTLSFVADSFYLTVNNYNDYMTPEWPYFGWVDYIRGTYGISNDTLLLNGTLYRTVAYIPMPPKDTLNNESYKVNWKFVQRGDSLFFLSSANYSYGHKLKKESSTKSIRKIYHNPVEKRLPTATRWFNLKGQVIKSSVYLGRIESNAYIVQNRLISKSGRAVNGRESGVGRQ